MNDNSLSQIQQLVEYQARRQRDLEAQTQQAYLEYIQRQQRELQRGLSQRSPLSVEPQPEPPMQETITLLTDKRYRIRIPLNSPYLQGSLSVFAEIQRQKPQHFGIDQNNLVLAGERYLKVGRIDSNGVHFVALFQEEGGVEKALTSAFSFIPRIETTDQVFFLIGENETLRSKVSFESVVVSKEKVNQIREAISQRKNADLIFNEWGFSEVFEKGTAVSLLFYGIPGTGKTLMAQAIADDLNMSLKIIGAADIQTSEPGGAERRIQGIFKEAKDNSVILLDECDSLLVDRNSVGHIMASQINTLLSAIEHFKGVVIFTTNRLGRLDAALERRIAAKIEFEFPDKKAREKIWKRMIPAKAPLADDVDFKALSEYPMTGGNIKNAVLNAARKAAYKELKKIDQSCFVDAVEKEIEAVQQFADTKQASYRQGNYIASSDQSIVQGDMGMQIKQIESFKENRA